MNIQEMNSGQIDDLTEKFHEVLHQNRREFSREIAKYVCLWEDIGEELLETVRNRAAKYPEVKTLLSFLGTKTLVLSEEHNPNLFFQTSSIFTVHQDFCRQVVSKAQLSDEGESFKIGCAELTRSASGKEVRAALSILQSFYEFEETELCAIIAILLAGQDKEKNLAEGCPNLFYTDSCLVIVNREYGNQRFGIGSSHCHDGDWMSGVRVFFPYYQLVKPTEST